MRIVIITALAAVLFSILAILISVFTLFEIKRTDKRLKSGMPKERILNALARYVSLCPGQIARETGLSDEEIIVSLKELEQEKKVERVSEEEDYPEMLRGWRLNLDHLRR